MPSPAAAASTTIQCFRAGRHTPMGGAPITFSESDLAASAAAYDPALHEAPLVIGHPTLDAPAYGWVSRVEQAAAALEATPRQVDPLFAQAVASGHLGKVSAAFFPPGSPHNPVPGVYYLKHIGFLGATPPAVKGLRNPAPAIAASISAAIAASSAYAQPDDDSLVFADWDDVTNAGLWRTLRDYVIGKWGLEEADKAISGWAVAQLEAAAQAETDDSADPASTGLTPSFANPLTPAETAVTPAEKLALETENARLREQLAASASANKVARLASARSAAVAFADGLVAGGQLAPAHRDVVVGLELAINAQAEADNGAPVQFGEGEARAALLPAVRTLLAGLPPLVAKGQTATAARAAQGSGTELAFAAPAGVDVDQERLVLHHQALAWQAAHPGSTYLGAVKAIGA